LTIHSSKTNVSFLQSLSSDILILQHGLFKFKELKVNSQMISEWLDYWKLWDG